MMDLAFFRLPDGRAWIGEGPFSESATPPDGPAFYINDFALSDSLPWKTPARLVPIESEADLEPYLAGAVAPTVIWQKPVTEWFKMAFRRIRRDVLAQRLLKMVPVLTEQGARREGDLRELLHRVWNAPKGLWSYAWLRKHQGFIGATPELLLEVEKNHLQTMALAGTSKPNADVSFETDTKEIEEHELVAGFLMDTLAEVGNVTRTPREVSEAAGLIHFRTHVSAELTDAPDLNGLIRRLHPTPAVGCLPRDETSLKKLMEYRHQMETPPFFGAPFGLKIGDSFHGVVAIRGVAWRGDKVLLPSGCGIVGGSAFDHEWRELRLKREAVARLLGI